MVVEILMVADCPNGPLLADRLAEALAGRAGARVVPRVIGSDAEAVRAGMRGSPTLLIDGHDPFAEPGRLPSLSCRIYRGEDGRTDGAPSVAALRRALDEHAGTAVMAGGGLVGRAGRGRLAPEERGMRAVQRLVLACFAERGRAPSSREIEETAARHGARASAVLAELHAGDFLRLDDAGRIRAAYPFSALPTPHRVRIGAGPQVFAMCAIDALGISAMTGHPATIISADPRTGEPVTVTVHNGTATWTPPTVVVFLGEKAGCDGDGETSPAADVCCGYLNFFAHSRNAAAWAHRHPEVTGHILGQTDALDLGVRTFGHLLDQDVTT